MTWKNYYFLFIKFLWQFFGWIFKVVSQKYFWNKQDGHIVDPTFIVSGNYRTNWGAFGVELKEKKNWSNDSKKIPIEALKIQKSPTPNPSIPSEKGKTVSMSQFSLETHINNNYCY